MRVITRVVLMCLMGMTACKSTAATGPADEAPEPPWPQAPPGPNTTSPFPIDRGDDGSGTPGSYKGLALRLVDNGQPAVTPVDGIIGFVCIGMSNSLRECTDFQNRVRTEFAGQINPAVRVINCAVGGHAIELWNDPAFDAKLWDACITQRLPEAGVRLDQVRVLWHKAADDPTPGPGNTPLPTYPSPGSDYASFFANLSTFSTRVHGKFPSVNAVYTSSRSYGGFAGNAAARGEPLSYEEGHALNQWLLTHAAVDGVWYGWAAYLWAPSCDTGITNKSGVCYDRVDYVSDGVHPSTSGQDKISHMLHARFLKEPWYRKP
ncbi:MAG: hypothetical protein ABIV28_05530 [Longimicrobiales bacterium]